MFHLVASAVWILAAWRYGDWRNWKLYQATILFQIASDLLHNFLLYQHPLWQYSPAPPLPNHTSVNLLVMFVIYPCGMLIYLAHYPKGFKQIPYVLAWVFLWSVVEWILLRLDLFHYYGGWRFEYSILFNIITFALLRLHMKKPLWAYLLAALVTVSILQIFDVHTGEMK